METFQSPESNRIKIAPRFFDLVLPELVEKGALSIRQSTVIQSVLREQGPEAATEYFTKAMRKRKID